MSLSAPKTKAARFGLFEADLERRLLLKGGLRVRLQDQPFQVLALLLERPGELVTREEIRQTLWPANTFVEFDDGLNTAMKKLRVALGDSAENPRFIETIPRRGYRFLAPVTIPTPLEHPALAPSTSTVPSEIVLERERSRLVIEKTTQKSTHVLVGLVLALAVIALAAVYFYRTGPHQERGAAGIAGSNAPTLPRRPSVAVIGFRNLSHNPEEAWLSTALSEMLNTELAAGERLRMVPGEEIARAKLDLSLSDTEALAKDSLSRVKANIGADYIVLGAYATVGEKDRKRLRLDLRVQDTRSGETLAEDAVDGTRQHLFDLVSEAGTRLRQRLQAAGSAAEKRVQVRASLPSNIKAARLYSVGLAKLRTFETLSARDLLLKAVAADPTFPMAHSALSSAWAALGYDSKALQEAKLAFDLAAQLSPEERLLAEGRYREANREWEKAIEIYRELWTSFPDNLDYGLRLASVQSSAGHGQDALVTLEALRRLPFGMGQDPRIDLEESRGAEMMGDFRRSQQAAEKAASKGRVQGAQQIVAQARSDEGWDWDRLGDFDEAAAALAEAKALFGAAGDHRSKALAINMIGDLLYDKGDYTNSLRTLNESLQLCRAHGFEKCAARSLNAIGHIQKDQGHLRQALSSYAEVLRVNRETGVRAGVGAALSNIGNVLQDLGDLPAASRKQEESLQVFTEIGDKRGMGATLSNMGSLLDDMGNLPGALQCFERAYKLDQETGYKRGFGFVLAGWGGVLMEQDRLPEARSKLEDALKIRRDMGSPSTVGDSLLLLARLALEEGNPSQAERLARDALTQFATLKESDDEVSAAAVLARSLLAEQRLSEAQTVVRQSLSRKGNSLPSLLDASLAVASVQAVQSEFAGAQNTLDSVIVQAKKRGLRDYELNARLELGKVQLQSGQAAAGRVQLTSLEKDARARSYFLIARKAGAALKMQ
jgi:tetratricopeptide (TPR) repeat protein/DNA-binding winged helix-turn-helix (wHTH) protein